MDRFEVAVEFKKDTPGGQYPYYACFTLPKDTNLIGLPEDRARYRNGSLTRGSETQERNFEVASADAFHFLLNGMLPFLKSKHHEVVSFAKPITTLVSEARQLIQSLEVDKQ